MFRFAAIAACLLIAVTAAALTSKPVQCFASAQHVQSIWDASLPIAEYEANAFTLQDIAALPAKYQPFAADFVGVTKAGALAMQSNLDCKLAR